MKRPGQSDDPLPAEAAEEVTARFESVPASESETGIDEVYVVFDGRRIAKRGDPGTLQAGTWVSLEPGFQRDGRRRRTGCDPRHDARLNQLSDHERAETRLTSPRPSKT